MAEHSILITAAGGHIGSQLVPQLLDGGSVKLVLPTSNAERLSKGLPSSATDDNVAVEEGRIQDPQWIQTLFEKHNVGSVFLCLTGQDELFTTLNIFDAMQRAGTVKTLVYLSACGDFISNEGLPFVMRVCSAGHVLVKPLIEQKLAHAGFPWKTVVIGPTLFMSNDERSRGSLMKEGYFDEPLGEVGVSRVNTSDIALGVRDAILNPEKWAGKKIMIGSLRRYTGAEICELWGQTLGRDVRICGSDEKSMLDFENRLEVKVSGGKTDVVTGWGRDLRLMYEVFAKVGFGMNEEEYKEQVELLGQEPVNYEEWVTKTGSSWKSG
ncbi:hypothetical protein BAUCODRAFT_199647 [Baudoinia panamericana UAMH 10762]|uniref:NmrA-like domain-containing protein n=1 Tax=Baudoinia panamericana (strain UAMH 10762) TaxID=717646 RepID=M2MW12_BAUPA|nr:uncharacterized protein BAUCODRAFT_199647 [Baudoinia panamericana UAMH 10762]EMD01162.1 hypothetical protein BAUCODRAFT_199647 [Baudoinia panamericana UAMH 10762]